ncbi:SigE family RNA polymerase sigma factor [Dactylosporangium roseum]|uniref:SigE family RNA polymerase sigma factor n=1 Tax=Dactylosporangium roseum TaxID=47989 RepID=A0ABY5YYM5_9ACTN|nr:SigE family RNA polymerase sigma factor [Dactylosporangium roseum]UWZ34851.1 SigE family RNA polymerase sigma factor [Dactylosporangium roseum]
MNQDDEAHFRDFVAARFDGLRSLAYLTCGDWHTAEDAVAASLAKLYVRWTKVDTPLAYARRAIVHTLVDESRRPWRRRERPAGHSLPDLPGPDHADQVDERIRIRAALARMAPGQRAVLVLRYYEGLSVEETAEVLGRQPGTVKSQTARGLAALRALLGTDELRVTDGLADGHPAGIEENRREGHGTPGSAYSADLGQGRRAATAAQR